MLAYMGESIQERTKQNLWKAAFKSFEWVWSALGRPYPLKFLKTVFHKFDLTHS